MKDALINHSKKALALKQFWMPKEFDDVEPEMAEELKRNFLIPRTTKTDFRPFKEKYGFDVPQEIKDYFDLYWHSYVCGCYDCMQQNETDCHKFDDGLTLFSVMKKKSESDDDVLLHENGLMDMTEEWYEDCREAVDEEPALAKYAEDMEDYIPIGWSLYYAYRVFFRRSTKEIYLESSSYEMGFVGKEPIARSLPEFINKLYFNPDPQFYK